MSSIFQHSPLLDIQLLSTKGVSTHPLMHRVLPSPFYPEGVYRPHVQCTYFNLMFCYKVRSLIVLRHSLQ
eukprot:scaffold20641_cov112-Skeletonema_dohrnii-CCMP3373.AAC.1